MKSFSCLFFLLAFLACNSTSYAQKITAGIYSGVNLSDIHSQETTGHWYHKPGPVQGIDLQYSFNRYLSVQTGAAFTTIYYEYKGYSSGYYYYPCEYSILPYPTYDETRKTDFRFVRVPLLAGFSVSSRIRLDIKGGLYYAFLTEYSHNFLFDNPDPVNTDLGYSFSTAFSIPLSGDFSASLGLGYSKGFKRMYPNSVYRHGSSEITLGLTYDGFLKKRRAGKVYEVAADTGSGRLTLALTGGINWSWNTHQSDNKPYSPVAGPSLGFILDYSLGKFVSLQTGVSFERKGYALRDSSNLFYLSYKEGGPFYDVDSRVDIDYIVIPLLLNFKFGQSVFFNTGPYAAIQLNSRCTGTAYSETRSASGYMLRKTLIFDDMEKVVRDDDLGWVFGGGVSLHLKKAYRANISVRYSTGFINVFDQKAAGYSHFGAPELSIRNGTLSVLLALQIPSSGN